MEQKAVIKFHAKLGTTNSETYKMMKKVYGDNCLSKLLIFEWHNRFLEGRETLEDEQHAGYSGPVKRTAKAGKKRAREDSATAAEEVSEPPKKTTKPAIKLTDEVSQNGNSKKTSGTASSNKTSTRGRSRKNAGSARKENDISEDVQDEKAVKKIIIKLF